MRAAATISVLVALAPLCATRAAAQHAPRLGGIAGYVVDSRGKPIVGARVVALGTPRMAVTGSEGEYRVDSVPPGQRQVRIRAPRFATLDVVLAVPSYDLADLDVRLDSAAAPADSLAPPDAPDLRQRAAARQGFDLFFTRPELDAQHARVITDLFRGQSFIVGRDGDAWSVGTASAHSIVTQLDAVPLEDLDNLQHSVAERAALRAAR